MTLERQPDNMPTNKAAVASSLAAVLAVYAQPAFAEVWPQIAPTMFSGPAATSLAAALLSTGIGLAVAWFVPDRAGEPV
jgi:hypothetical protein